MTEARNHGEEMAYYLGDLEAVRDAALESDEWSVLHAVIESTLPVRNAWIMRERISARVFDRSVIPRTTLRSKGEAGRLSVEQSERAVRIGRVYARAAEVFGDRERATAWLERPSPAFEGRSPAEWLGNEAGARYIEEILGRLEHGIAA